MSAPDNKHLKDMAPQYFPVALKQDPELRRAYHDNIAMAFKDSYAQYKRKTGKKSLSYDDIHVVANNAAKYFLELLCGEIKYPDGR